ncbi:MAG: hypothetical protein Tsb0020_10600 [Haliangiales bacterium]
MLPLRAALEPLQINLDIIDDAPRDDARIRRSTGRRASARPRARRFTTANDSEPSDTALRNLGEKHYRVRTRGSFRLATLDWDDDLWADLVALRRPQQDPDLLQRLSDRLGEFLQSTDWPQREADLQTALARNQPVHITICADAPEIYALPWNLLALASSSQYLGELPGVIIRFSWQESRQPRLSPQLDRGCILLAWSAAAGQVPAAEHIAALRAACGRMRRVFDERRDIVAHVSWTRLYEALEDANARNRPVRILHIVCHGMEHGDGICLAWNDDDSDGAAIIDGPRLRQLLAEYAPELRLVILSACDSSREDRLSAHLGSLARTLHRAGIQTVIGSAVPLSTRGSVTFAKYFYRALIRHRASVTRAFMAARRPLAGHLRTHDWLALRYYAHPDAQRDDSPFDDSLAKPWRRRLRRALALAVALAATLTAASYLPIEALMNSSTRAPKPTPRQPISQPPTADDGVRVDHTELLSTADGGVAQLDRLLVHNDEIPASPLQAETAERFLFELFGCQRAVTDKGIQTTCALRVTNQGTARKLLLYAKRTDTRSEIHDELDRKSRAWLAWLDGKGSSGGTVSAQVMPGQSMSARIEFRHLAPDAKHIAHLIVRFGVEKRDPPYTVQFRDVPLTPAATP